MKQIFIGLVVFVVGVVLLLATIIHYSGSAWPVIGIAGVAMLLSGIALMNGSD